MQSLRKILLVAVLIACVAAKYQQKKPKFEPDHRTLEKIPEITISETEETVGGTEGTRTKRARSGRTKVGSKITTANGSKKNSGNQEQNPTNRKLRRTKIQRQYLQQLRRQDRRAPKLDLEGSGFDLSFEAEPKETMPGLSFEPQTEPPGPQSNEPERELESTRRPKPSQPNSKTRKPQSNPDNGNYNCSGNYLTVEERKAITDKHNEFRSQMAKGKAMNRDGKYMPPGRNVYALTYNCTLEKQAQAWVNQCIMVHSPGHLRPNCRENIYWYDETVIEQKRFENAGVEASTSWWSELSEFYSDNPSNEIKNRVRMVGDISHFLTMAWGETTAIGCGKAVCPMRESTYVHVICHYYVKSAWIDKKIYEPDISHCRQDEDCDTYLGSKCLADKGLCLKE